MKIKESSSIKYQVSNFDDDKPREACGILAFTIIRRQRH